eukprot:15317015-Alexandrium_andersonii.AAC.1
MCSHWTRRPKPHPRPPGALSRPGAWPSSRSTLSEPGSTSSASRKAAGRRKLSSPPPPTE